MNPTKNLEGDIKTVENMPVKDGKTVLNKILQFESQGSFVSNSGSQVLRFIRNCLSLQTTNIDEKDPEKENAPTDPRL